MSQRLILYTSAAILIGGLVPHFIDDGVFDAPKILEPVIKTEDREPVHAVVEEGRLKKGQVFINILLDSGMERAEAMKVCSGIEEVYDLRSVRPGHKYRLAFDPAGNLKEVFYRIDDENYLKAEVSAAGVSPVLEKDDFRIKLNRTGGTIDNSLFNAVSPDGNLDRVAMELADIFAWSVDFYYDLRRGDTVKVLYEEKYREDRLVKTGRILAAELNLSGKSYRAFLYKNGDRWDYFDEEGESLRKQFLKMPVKYARISSGFTYKRYHPVLKRYRPHLGVDYAAAYGTPILATAGGVVQAASYNRSSGRYVKLKHGSIYSTAYSHLSKFGRGIRKGTRVEQGDVIGYVGSTGLSTGPHVDYRLRVRGKSINPLTFRSPGADPVLENDFQRFSAVKGLLERALTGGTNMPSHIMARNRLNRVYLDLDAGKAFSLNLPSLEKPGKRAVSLN